MKDGIKTYIISQQGKGGLQKHKCTKCLHRTTANGTPYTLVEAKNLCVYVWRNVAIEIDDLFTIKNIIYIQPRLVEYGDKSFLKLILSADIEVAGQKENNGQPFDKDSFVESGEDDDFPF